MKTRARKRSNKSTSFERKFKSKVSWEKHMNDWEDYLWQDLLDSTPVLWDPYTSYYTN